MNQNQIKQSLMRIKQNQAKLLQQLQTQHTNLQDIYLSASQANPSNTNNNFDNSLQISRSEGNLIRFNNLSQHNTPQNIGLLGQNYLNIGSNANQYPYVSFNYAKSVSTSGAEELISNKNKKIQELLNQQRKVYQENHVLQQENEALLEDYRKLKKMYYETKEAMKDSVLVMDFVTGNVLYSTIKGLILEMEHNTLSMNQNKEWQKFRLQHPKIFGQKNQIQPLLEICERSVEKTSKLLVGQRQKEKRDEKGEGKRKQKEKEQQIMQLKYKITNLINMNDEINRNKSEMQQLERQKYIQLEKQSFVLSEKIKIMEKQIIRHQSNFITKNQDFQKQIVTAEAEVRRLVSLLKTQQNQVEDFKVNFKNIRSQLDIANTRVQDTDNQLKNIKHKLREKQQQYNTQIEISHRQNILIQKLTIDLQSATSRPIPQQPINPSIIAQNERLCRELSIIQLQYNRYRESSKKQLSSLLTHNRQIKNQYEVLIKSQQNARLNQQRYRELVAVKQKSLMLGVQIEHLWAVKEIEYDNLVGVLKGIKETGVIQMRQENMNNRFSRGNNGGDITVNEINYLNNGQANGVQYGSPRFSMLQSRNNLTRME